MVLDVSLFIPASLPLVLRLTRICSFRITRRRLHPCGIRIRRAWLRRTFGQPRIGAPAFLPAFAFALSASARWRISAATFAYGLSLSIAALFLSGFLLSGASLVLPIFGALTTDWISSELMSLLKSGCVMMCAGGFHPFLEELACALVPKTPSNFSNALFVQMINLPK